MFSFQSVQSALITYLIICSVLRVDARRVKSKYKLNQELNKQSIESMIQSLREARYVNNYELTNKRTKHFVNNGSSQPAKYIQMPVYHLNPPSKSESKSSVFNLPSTNGLETITDLLHYLVDFNEIPRKFINQKCNENRALNLNELNPVAGYWDKKMLAQNGPNDKCSNQICKSHLSKAQEEGTARQSSNHDSLIEVPGDRRYRPTFDIVSISDGISEPFPETKCEVEEFDPDGWSDGECRI